MSVARQAVLQRRLAARGLANTRASGPARLPGSRHPLTPAQSRMWFLQQRNPLSVAYNVAVAFDLGGSLDADRLRGALDVVVRRHEVLRTTYHADAGGVPWQQVRDDLAATWSVYDVAEGAEPDRQQHIERLASGEARHVFDLSSESPLRVALIRKAADEHVLVLVAHHIAWDDDCWDVFFDELMAAYGSCSTESREPAAQFLDVAAAAATTAADEDVVFWRDFLAGAPAGLDLAPVSVAVSETEERGQRKSLHLPGAVADAVADLARSEAATPFAVLLAAFGAVLHRYTDRDDFLVGTPVVNRDSPDAEKLIGYFGNTVVLRAQVRAGDTFRAHVARTMGMCSSAFAHKDVDVEIVRKQIEPQPVGRLLSVMFATRKAPEAAMGTAALNVARRPLHNGTAQFPLSVTVEVAGDDLVLEADFLTAVFPPAFVERLLEHLRSLLEAALADPDHPVAALVMCPADERARLLEHASGQTAPPYQPVASAVEHQAATVPDNLAVLCGPARLTYAELNERANRLAHHLIEAGVSSGDVVALTLPRSTDLVVSLLAVLKTGAAYLPVDVSYPAGRIAAMLEEARPRLVVTELPAELARQPGGDPGIVPPAASPAYIGFTSGSTGHPKGLVGTHGGLANRLRWAQQAWPSSPSGARLAKSSFSFIDGHVEILEGLTAGATVVVAQESEAKDPHALGKLLTRHQVDHLMLVPSLLAALVEEVPEVVGAPRRWVSTGETLRAPLAQRLLRTSDPDGLVNSYGCTEVTGDVVAGPAVMAEEGDEVITVGTPAAGVRAYVLDGGLQLAPPGVAGELYIAGAQLATGYLGPAALTSERFVADPFGTGERMYRTGDLARWTGSGRLELVGRRDGQMNLRGLRVEPAEIEVALERHPAVTEAVVVAHPLEQAQQQAQAQLAAYVVRATGATVDVVDLRSSLRAQLPDHMVPEVIVPMDALPRLPNGKCDRHALPVPDLEPAGSGRAARNDREAALCRVVAEVLELDVVGIDDDFFALGGDSISSMSLVRRAAEAGFTLTVPDVFDRRTVAGLAAADLLDEADQTLPRRSSF